MAAQRSLFVRWLRTTTLLLVLIGGGLAALYLTRSGPDANALFRVLPEGTGNVVAVRGLGKLLGAMNQMAAQPNAPDELKKFAAELAAQSRAELGFDASQPEAWQKAGFEPDAAWGLAVGTDAEALTSFAYLPERSPGDAEATFAAALQKLGATVSKDGEVSRVTWPQSVGEDNSTPRAFASSREFLVVLCTAKAAPGNADALRKQLAAGGLDRVADFVKMRAAVGDPWTLFGYVAPAQIGKALAAEPGGKALAAYVQGGAGFALDIADKRISARLRIVGGASGFPALAAAHAPADHLGGPALAVGRASLDLNAIVAQLGTTPEGKKTLDQARAVAQAHALDLDKDLLPVLDGQLALAAFPAAEGSKLPAEGAVLVGVKDPEKAKALLPKLTQGLPLLPDSKGWYRMPLGALGIAVGVAGNALMVVAGDARVDASVAGTGASLADALPPEVQKAYRDGPSLYAYADLERSAELLTRAPVPGAGAAKRVLRGLQGASLALDVQGGVLRLDADLWPPNGSFGKAIVAAP